MDDFNKKNTLKVLVAVGIIVIVSSLFKDPVTAQQQASITPTSTMGLNQAYVTVPYREDIDWVNVRSGPGSYDYEKIGELFPGETAPAVGKSPAGEWIQIVYDPAPLGTGWVYAANVTLSPEALLPVVEPPPTKMPDIMLTPNATFAAEFKIEIPPTRMPTFTLPSPLIIPTFQNSSGNPRTNGISSWLIIGLGVVGVSILLFSNNGKR